VLPGKQDLPADGADRLAARQHVCPARSVSAQGRHQPSRASLEKVSSAHARSGGSHARARRRCPAPNRPTTSAGQGRQRGLPRVLTQQRGLGRAAGPHQRRQVAGRHKPRHLCEQLDLLLLVGAVPDGVGQVLRATRACERARDEGRRLLTASSADGQARRGPQRHRGRRQHRWPAASRTRGLGRPAGLARRV